MRQPHLGVMLLLLACLVSGRHLVNGDSFLRVVDSSSFRVFFQVSKDLSILTHWSVETREAATGKLVHASSTLPQIEPQLFEYEVQDLNPDTTYLLNIDLFSKDVKKYSYDGLAVTTLAVALPKDDKIRPQVGSDAVFLDWDFPGAKTLLINETSQSGLTIELTGDPTYFLLYPAKPATTYKFILTGVDNNALGSVDVTTLTEDFQFAPEFDEFDVFVSGSQVLVEWNIPSYLQGYISGFTATLQSFFESDLVITKSIPGLETKSVLFDQLPSYTSFAVAVSINWTIPYSPFQFPQTGIRTLSHLEARSFYNESVQMLVSSEAIYLNYSTFPQSFSFYLITVTNDVTGESIILNTTQSAVFIRDELIDEGSFYRVDVVGYMSQTPSWLGSVFGETISDSDFRATESCFNGNPHFEVLVSANAAAFDWGWSEDFSRSIAFYDLQITDAATDKVIASPIVNGQQCRTLVHGLTPATKYKMNFRIRDIANNEKVPASLLPSQFETLAADVTSTNVNIFVSEDAAVVSWNASIFPASSYTVKLSCPTKPDFQRSFTVQGSSQIFLSPLRSGREFKVDVFTVGSEGPTSIGNAAFTTLGQPRDGQFFVTISDSRFVAHWVIPPEWADLIEEFEISFRFINDETYDVFSVDSTSRRFEIPSRIAPEMDFEVVLLIDWKSVIPLEFVPFPPVYETSLGFNHIVNDLSVLVGEKHLFFEWVIQQSAQMSNFLLSVSSCTAGSAPKIVELDSNARSYLYGFEDTLLPGTCYNVGLQSKTGDSLVSLGTMELMTLFQGIQEQQKMEVMVSDTSMFVSWHLNDVLSAQVKDFQLTLTSSSESTKAISLSADTSEAEIFELKASTTYTVELNINWLEGKSHDFKYSPKSVTTLASSFELKGVSFLVGTSSVLFDYTEITDKFDDILFTIKEADSSDDVPVSIEFQSSLKKVQYSRLLPGKRYQVSVLTQTEGSPDNDLGSITLATLDLPGTVAPVTDTPTSDVTVAPPVTAAPPSGNKPDGYLILTISDVRIIAHFDNSAQYVPQIKEYELTFQPVGDTKVEKHAVSKNTHMFEFPQEIEPEADYEIGLNVIWSDDKAPHGFAAQPKQVITTLGFAHAARNFEILVGTKQLYFSWYASEAEAATGFKLTISAQDDSFKQTVEIPFDQRGFLFGLNGELMSGKTYDTTLEQASRVIGQMEVMTLLPGEAEHNAMSVMVSHDSIYVSWTLNLLDEKVKNYVVEIASPSGQPKTFTLEAKETSFYYTNAEPSTSYIVSLSMIWKGQPQDFEFASKPVTTSASPLRQNGVLVLTGSHSIAIDYGSVAAASDTFSFTIKEVAVNNDVPAIIASQGALKVAEYHLIKPKTRYSLTFATESATGITKDLGSLLFYSLASDGTAVVPPKDPTAPASPDGHFILTISDTRIIAHFDNSPQFDSLIQEYELTFQQVGDSQIQKSRVAKEKQKFEFPQEIDPESNYEIGLNVIWLSGKAPGDFVAQPTQEITTLGFAHQTPGFEVLTGSKHLYFMWEPAEGETVTGFKLSIIAHDKSFTKVLELAADKRDLLFGKSGELEAGKSYDVVLEAVNSGGFRVIGNMEIRTLLPGEAEHNIMSTMVSHDSIYVTWVLNVLDEQVKNYVINITSTDGTQSFSVDASESTFYWTNAKPSTPYLVSLSMIWKDEPQDFAFVPKPVTTLAAPFKKNGVVFLVGSHSIAMDYSSVADTADVFVFTISELGKANDSPVTLSTRSSIKVAEYYVIKPSTRYNIVLGIRSETRGDKDLGSARIVTLGNDGSAPFVIPSDSGSDRDCFSQASSLSAVSGPDQAIIFWSAPSRYQNTLVKYQLTISKKGEKADKSMTLLPNECLYHAKSWNSKTTYTVTVTLILDDSKTENLPEIYVTTLSSKLGNDKLTALVNKDAAAVMWKAVSDPNLDHYQVQFEPSPPQSPKLVQIDVDISDEPFALFESHVEGIKMLNSKVAAVLKDGSSTPVGELSIPLVTTVISQNGGKQGNDNHIGAIIAASTLAIAVIVIASIYVYSKNQSDMNRPILNSYKDQASELSAL